MRLKIRGKATLQDIHNLLDYLHRGTPDLEWHNVNIYMTLKDADGTEVSLTRGGEEFEVIELRPTSQTS
jgi:hypothetical protein